MEEKALCPQCGMPPGPAVPVGDQGACPQCGVALGLLAEPGATTDPATATAVAVAEGVRSQDSVRGDTVAEASVLELPGVSAPAAVQTPNDGTVGGFATVGPAPADGVVGWQKGMIIADRFEIEAFIGQGGMGTVYLARDMTLKRPIALKCVPQEILFDGDARDDLRQEANRLLDLAHENVVRIHTYYDGSNSAGGRSSRGEGWPFFAMEYLQGPTLKHLLRQRRQAGRPFSNEEVLLIARQVARGLSYAHSKGVIHRDLKPGNLMLVETPRSELGDRDVIKITDFGISRVIEDTKQRHTGKRSGTLPYMSPEQFRGEPTSVQGDIYSFACTLYELISGLPPFHTGDIGYQILEKQPKPIPGIPRPLNDALLRGLAKEPSARFDSVSSFLRALEGRRAPARASTLRALTALGALAAGVLVVLSLGAFLATPESRTPGRNARELGAAEVRARLPAPSEERLAELQEFRKRVQAAIEKAIPFQIGRDFAYATAATPDTLSLRVAIPEPRSSSFQRGLLDELFLVRYGESPQGRETLEGSVLEGNKVFQLERLREGPHLVRAYLQKPDGTTEQLLEDPHKFRIDLTPPSFQVVPQNPEVFLESGPPYRLTFDEVVDLKIVSTHDVGDIAEAYTQIVFGEGARPFEQLQKLPFWRVELPPGSMTTYRVYARDAAQNRSAALEINLQRLRLEVERFALVPEGIHGNQVLVQGLVRVEGEQSPALRYFVNERLTEPVSESGLHAAPPPAVVPGRRDPAGVPFSAALLLPQAANNTIEVRYAWRDNPPQPFARPARITDVKVSPPRIALEAPPSRTSQSRVRLGGRVEPHFEGLQIAIEQRGRGSRNVALTASSMSGQASFAEEVDLLEGENVLLLKTYYKDAPLGSPLPELTVYLDRVPPSSDGPPLVELAGDTVLVSLHVSEDLKRFRAHEVWASGESSAWRTVEPDRSGRGYSFAVPLPQKPFTFKIELVDLADNEAVIDQHCPVPLDGPGPGRDVLPDGIGLTAVSHAEGGVRKPLAGVAGPLRVRGATIIASRFLTDLGMEFVPVGPSRVEIGRTEVPESAWFQFLRESGHGDRGNGRLNAPLRLEGSSPELLRDFARWFEEKASDGYRYDIPTVEEWTLGFAGVGEIELAREVLKAWFVGVLKGGARFRSRPRVPYGDGAASDIGARPENATPSKLLDMEASVQEIVRDESVFKVLGGTNGASAESLLELCSTPRAYDGERRLREGRWTGVRLVRKPVGGR